MPTSPVSFAEKLTSFKPETGFALTKEVSSTFSCVSFFSSLRKSKFATSLPEISSISRFLSADRFFAFFTRLSEISRAVRDV